MYLLLLFLVEPCNVYDYDDSITIGIAVALTLKVLLLLRTVASTRTLPSAVVAAHVHTPVLQALQAPRPISGGGRQASHDAAKPGRCASLRGRSRMFSTSVTTLLAAFTNERFVVCAPPRPWFRLAACNGTYGRPRLNLPLGPGLFEVRNALKAVDQMNKMPLPMLVMCKSGKRAGATRRFV